MKNLNRASVVFLLIDTFTKSSVIRAQIKCNGKVIPYTKKNNGYYIFLNMLDGTFNFEISCDGYCTVNQEVTINSDTVTEVTIPMQKAVGSLDMYSKNKIIFDIKKDGKPFANKDVKVRLDTKVVFLRVISPIERDSELIEINYDYNTNLLFQEYYYSKRPNFDVYFIGYDWEEKKYKLKDKSKAKVEKGGYLCPVWNLKTDINGRLLFPINSFYINKENAEFTVTANDMQANATVEISNNTEVILELKDKPVNNIVDDQDKSETKKDDISVNKEKNGNRKDKTINKKSKN